MRWKFTANKLMFQTPTSPSPFPSQLLFIGIIFKGTVFAFHIFDDDEADFGRSLKPWKSKIRISEFSSLDLTFTKFHMWINDLDLERLDWEGSICSLATWWLSSCKVAKNKQPVVSKFLFTLWLLFVGRGLVLLHFLTRRRRKQTQTPDFLQEMHFCFFYKLLESAFKSSIEWLPLSKTHYMYVHILCIFPQNLAMLRFDW